MESMGYQFLLISPDIIGYKIQLALFNIPIKMVVPTPKLGII